MIDLEKKVFGTIRAKEILGADPPAEAYTRDRLSAEFERLAQQLPNKSKEELESILKYQEEIQRQVNSRPGAMALPQDKIKMFMVFSTNYVDRIKNPNLTLKSLKTNPQGFSTPRSAQKVPYFVTRTWENVVDS